MIKLENESLRVSLLDPIADASRMGSRYVTGGYIWQIADIHNGNILTGAEFPSPQPALHNGQGAPEVFQFTCYEKEDEIPEKRLILGVGIVGNAGRKKANELHWHDPVEQPAHWDVRTTTNTALFSTIQDYEGWHLRLTRRVEIEGRTVRSSSALLNTAHQPLTFRWFAHPFFPLMPDLRCCSFPEGWGLEHNPAFALDEQHTLCMHKEYRWTVGHFELVRGCEHQLFSVRQLHPVAGAVELRGDFPLHRVAVWANDKTFSVEPFHAGVLASGDEDIWSLAYTVGTKP